MPISVKNVKARARADVEKSVGDIPTIRRPAAVEARDIDTMFAEFTDVKSTDVPSDIEQCSIDFQGEKGSGKSSLAAGNERALYACLTDGQPIIPRALATVKYIRSLDALEAFFDTTLDKYAAKYGVNGQFRTLVLDPTIVAVQWMLARELRKANVGALKQFELDKRYKRVDEDATFEGYDSIRDVPSSNLQHFPKVAEMLLAWGDRFRSFGWGFWTLTHYRWGPKYEKNPTKPMANMRGDWIPDIPGSSAHVISKYSDMLIVCEKRIPKIDGGYGRPIYSVGFQRDGGESLGSRVPIYGDATFLDYKDRNTPPNYVNFHTLRARYNKAREEWVAEQRAFADAVSGV